MPRDSEVYLQDILDAIDKVNGYRSGMTRDEFEADSKTVDAVLRNLEIIGEAVKGVPKSFREAHPGIEWRRIAGLRDVLIHHYYGVNMNIIWDILTNELPRLEKGVRNILSE